MPDLRDMFVLGFCTGAALIGALAGWFGSTERTNNGIWNKQHRRAHARDLIKKSRTPPFKCPPQNVIAECCGPCEYGFEYCDCGLFGVLNPIEKPKPHGGRIIRDDRHPDFGGYQPIQTTNFSDKPNPPSRHP